MSSGEASVAGGPGSGRTGRRPGGPDTRTAILDSARTLFAEGGLRGTTVRAVAAGAGVDSALVHHYFGTKQDLFLAAAEVPVDPEVVRSRIRTLPFPGLGDALCEAVLGLWETEAGAAMLARFRTSVATDHGDEFGDFLLSAAMPLLSERVREGTGVGVEESERRVALGMTQLVGVILSRHVLRLPAIQTVPVGELATAIGPVVQAHFEGRTTSPL